MLASPLVVKIDEPEYSSHKFNPYITYRVSSEPMGYYVRRRYSDFAWLRETLSARYVGVLVAALPEKKAFSSWQKDNFIKLRMRALSIFMDRVILNPYLKSDVSLMDFLSISDAKEWEKAKKKPELPDQGKGSNVGDVKWKEAIDRYVVPDGSEAIIVNVKRQLEQMDKVYKDLLKCTAKLVEKSMGISAEMGEFRLAFSHLQHIESISPGGGGGGSGRQR